MASHVDGCVDRAAARRRPRARGHRQGPVPPAAGPVPHRSPRRGRRQPGGTGRTRRPPRRCAGAHPYPITPSPTGGRLNMVMSPTLIESVKQRASDERERKAYPEGFPELPPVPAARYCDPEFAALENEGVFARSWLMVAHLDELPNPGDFRLVEQIPQPVVLLRGDDGAVRAFYNTCQHRGAALVDEVAGHAGRRLTCPYHSWVYDLEGALVGLPDAASFPDLDRDCLSLKAVRCETWGPLVFINLDPDAEPLQEFLSPVNADLSEIGEVAGRLHLIDHGELAVDVNWKFPVDANIETYHVNTVHRESAAKALDQASTGIQLLRNGHSRMLIRMHDGRTLAGLL